MKQKFFLFLVIAIILASTFPTSACTDSTVHSDASLSGGWSVSPIIGFISGGYIIDTPQSGDLMYGLKISNYRSRTTWIDAGVSSLGRSGKVFFVNSRANYRFFRSRILHPFISTGAGFITSTSGGVFDFLYGGGLVVTIDDRITVSQSYIIHYSPSQALSDNEGNPVNSFETSLHIWF